MKPDAPIRTLALAVGNSTVLGGVFSGDRLVRRFRLPAAAAAAPAALDRWLAARARGRIDSAVLCSVVPALTPDAWIGHLYAQQMVNQGQRGFVLARIGSSNDNPVEVFGAGPWSDPTSS